MKKILRRKFNRYIKSNELVKAAIVKNFYTILGVVAGTIWLVFWGADSIYQNASLPTLKVIAIVIGYVGSLVKLCVEPLILENKKLNHAIARQKRVNKNA